MTTPVTTAVQPVQDHPALKTAQDLAAVGAGFADPVQAAQQVFRAVLEAMSRPGRVQTLSAAALQGLVDVGPRRADAPAASNAGAAMTAVLLALLDTETRLWLDPSMAGRAQHLRFHTGVRLVEQALQADFLALPARAATADLWTQACAGSDEQPQCGATVLVEVPVLHAKDPTGTDATTHRGDAMSLQLAGPGIQLRHDLWVGGLSTAFWQARAALEPALPRGVDLILCCGNRLAALPRSTYVTWED
jgi:alpha-D-ribose 1-methylphosphonate 5-triphosphate synthase subunit PhnH